MKLLVSLLLIGTPALVEAQAFQPSMPPAPAFDTARRLDGVFNYVRSNDTPTMRAQKLRRAIALREEAAVLLANDGGTLSDHNRAYVRRKALNILDGSR
ncbi:hypothetical protein FSB78_16465 [Sphingomonas ginsenosidivorax]|uniref:DUF4148 domain-containing protein n=1 Tax=Sphingomonas ginsenosidivorax TaxID=862135 RepID=A0A5C6UI36_9SPHN|nr:hypothetical protein [Sphingomonas ginsenosidivorax]TXC72359.1 hypothetical protein FSB78_16465 [Sphingomonas ginsenosidivorax]